MRYHLTKFLKPNQRELFGMLRSFYKGAYAKKGKFLLVEGTARVLLIAHLDTVHKDSVRDICVSADNNIYMSPQGIGGDDRCGVYALVNIYEQSPIKPYLLFTCDEEIGGLGAQFFCDEYQELKLPVELYNAKMIIEIDRRGSNDAVYYDCFNADFEKYVTSKGFKTSLGSFSDISYIAPAMGIAAVNLSSGYYNAHTTSEYIVKSEIDAVIEKVVEMVTDSTKKDFPSFKYAEKPKTPYFDDSIWSKSNYGCLKKILHRSAYRANTRKCTTL